MEHTLALEWVPVATHKPEKSYCFGTKRSHLATDCECAAVYRWIFQPLGNPSVCLVGSTEDLYRRVGEYNSHSSDHHKNVRKAFQEHISGGGLVILERLRFDSFTINGVEFSEKTLVNRFIREALEKICCVSLEKQGFKLLNSTLQKQLLRKLMSLQAKLPPAEFAEIIRQLEQKSKSKE